MNRTSGRCVDRRTCWRDGHDMAGTSNCERLEEEGNALGHTQ